MMLGEKRLAWGVVLVLSLPLVLAGCGAGARATTRLVAAPSATATPATPSSGTAVHDYATLVRALTAAGATVQAGQPQPAGVIFSVPGREVTLNGTAHLSAFEYPDATAAAGEAACFHGGDKMCPGANSAAMIDYVAPPHLYRAGRVIVVYVGSDAATLHLLASVLGPPFDERR